MGRVAYLEMPNVEVLACKDSMSGALVICLSLFEHLSGLIAVQSNTKCIPGSNAPEYLGDIPEIADGSINMSFTPAEGADVVYPAGA